MITSTALTTRPACITSPGTGVKVIGRLSRRLERPRTHRMSRVLDTPCQDVSPARSAGRKILPLARRSLDGLRRSLARVRCALCALTLASTSVRAQEAIPELTQPVNDFAKVIDPESARNMDALIRSLQQASGDVVVVATVPTYE